jgi:hypothetical protein
MITHEDLDVERLTQVAMWGYIDQAQAAGHAHDRLVRASRAAALAVVGKLRDDGVLRTRVAVRQAVHGTTAGYAQGCRCEYCTEASNLYQRANYHWNRRQGHNKVQS